MWTASNLRPPVTDVLAALALASWALATSGPDHVVGVPAALLMTVPLAWRRRAALGVAALVGCGFALQAAQADPPESLATVVAVMVAAYSVAGSASSRAAVLGVLVLVAGGCAETAATGQNDYGFIVVVIAAAATAGHAMGRRSRAAEAERERDAAQAVVAERERIARELHDSVAHAVSLMVVQAGAAETAIDKDGQAAQALERIRATGQEAVADLGRMLGLLRGGTNGVEPVGGMADLDRLVETFRSAGLDVQLEIEGAPQPLPAGLDGAAFRIAQEALTNALKHGAGSARLIVGYEPRSLRLFVANPVPARAATTGGTGHGVVGMRERARLYDGDLRAHVTRAGDYELEAWLPLPAPT